MNYEKSSVLFHNFFEKHLVPLGFVLKTPTLAERVVIGMRQVITCEFSEHGGVSAFDMDLFWAYTHELDDAPPNTALVDGRKPACSGYTQVIHAFDVLSDSDVTHRLEKVRIELLALLGRTQSAAQIYTAVTENAPVGPTLLGEDPMAMSFNYAHCMEIAGKQSQAAKMYASLSRSRRSDRSQLAMRVREVAYKRAMALKSYLPDAELEQLTEPTSNTETCAPAVAEAIPEAELAKKCVPLHLQPHEVMPKHFAEAIEQAYRPSMVFWCRVNAEQYVDEVERKHPEFMNAVTLAWIHSGCGSFREDLINEIRTRQFDEFCAMWLLSLPQGQVSNDDDEVFELLYNHLDRTGESTHLRYLELDGVKAVRYIRDKMDSLFSC